MLRQHDEEGEAEADGDLGAEAEAEPDDEQRRQRDARHRVQRREDRVEQRFVVGLVTNSMPTSTPAHAAEHEGAVMVPRIGPAEVVQQAAGDEHLLPKILHDAARPADQDRVDQFRVAAAYSQKTKNTARITSRAAQIWAVAHTRFGRSLAQSLFELGSTPANRARGSAGSFCSARTERGRPSVIGTSAMMRPGRALMTMTRSDIDTASLRSWVTNTHRTPLALPQRQQHVLQLQLGLRIERAERLVHQQDRASRGRTCARAPRAGACPATAPWDRRSRNP